MERKRRKLVHSPESQFPIENDSLLYVQDYEYELSVIADMEKRERQRQAEQKYEEQEVQEKQRKRLETRDFHIKQVLRKLKLGSSTNPEHRTYIYCLESWMESVKEEWETEHADSFHAFLENGMRLNEETKEYMRAHIRR